MLLFKIDATNLYERVRSRQREYIEIFSLKRSRAVFKDIFENRYAKASAFDLAHCPQEVIEVLDVFYTAADDLYWYLKHTQDMPNTIEDVVSRKIARLGKLYEQLALFVDAELSGEGQERPELEDFGDISSEDIPADDIHNDSFVMDGEKRAEDSQTDFIQPEEFPDPEEMAQGNGEDSENTP